MERRTFSGLPLFLLCAVLALCASFSALAEPELTDRGIDLGTAGVHWPALTGMDDEEAQQTLNLAIRESCGIDAYTARIASVMDADPPLTVSWEGTLRGDLLSCVIRAEGPLTGARPRFEWHTVHLDLRTGEAFPMTALFSEPEEAVEWIEAYLEEDVLPGMSAHLMNCELTPLPDDFRIGPEGLTLYYPIERLSTLSDRAGAVTLSWGELAEWLDLSEGSAADRFGIAGWMSPADGAFLESLSSGSLPGLPCALGDSMETLTAQYRLLCDPDLYDGGRYIQLEDSRFRLVYLMTDDLSEKRFDGSTLNGIRCDRFGLYGLVTRRTAREEALETLGEPYASVELDAGAADAMRLPEGTSDYYRCGEFRLRLHYDSGDILTSLFLLP